MSERGYSGFGFEPMTEKLFLRFSTFIRNELGIKMPDAKKTMLQARLQKRLRMLGMNNYEDYAEYVFSDQGIKDELPHMIDAVTTNKTDFFREAQHFPYLVETALPEMIRLYGAGTRRKARVWSAGCSTGEEPYTLAMVLTEYRGRCAGYRFEILGTDISSRVLRDAARGIYTHEKVAPVPLPLRKKFLLKSKDRQKDLVRVIPALRERVTFKWLNFMGDYFGINDTFDIIFCRNVLIYFDRKTQETVLNRVCRYLLPGGFFFAGHSETLNGLNVPLVQASSTIYRKPI